MIADLWYKNGVIYCLSVGTYMDANGDGIGDFKGLLRRVGATAFRNNGGLWLWVQAFAGTTAVSGTCSPLAAYHPAAEALRGGPVRAACA